MEVVVADVEIIESGFFDGDAFGIYSPIDVAGNVQASFGFCRSDELDDNLMTDKRSAAPIDADE